MSEATIDYVERMFARLRATDSKYGSQDHQKKFMARIRAYQRIEPCTKDHGEGDHVYAGDQQCYSAATKAKAELEERTS
jgi:hypothetical protein